MPFRIPGPVAIYFAVIRETYGFQRKSAEISTERFKKITGIEHRNNIYRAIQQAIESKLITAIKNDGKKYPTYSIQKNYSKWSCAIKNDVAIKNDGASNQKRWRKQSKMMAVCMLKKPSKETSKEKRIPPPASAGTPTGGATPEQPEHIQRKKQLPPDFTLTDDLTSYARSQGLNVDIESVFAHFCDYHLAKGSTMLDWTAAWRTWVRNELRFSAKRKSYTDERKAGVDRTMKIFEERERERQREEQEEANGRNIRTDDCLLPD